MSPLSDSRGIQGSRQIIYDVIYGRPDVIYDLWGETSSMRVMVISGAETSRESSGGLGGPPEGFTF
jgi:hypothetical protein